MSATVTILMLYSLANSSRSGMRAMVPSSFMTSQMTPAGFSPAKRERSTEPSVCPVRTRVPPFRDRKGKMCPGLTMSSGLTSSAMAVRIVWARSAALMPVDTPLRASMETVKAVWNRDRFVETIIGSRSRSTQSGVSERHIKPLPYFAMKLTASGVTFSAAMQRSPSFSRSSSSTRMTILPCRMSSRASGMVARGIVENSLKRMRFL